MLEGNAERGRGGQPTNQTFFKMAWGLHGAIPIPGPRVPNASSTPKFQEAIPLSQSRGPATVGENHRV